MYFIPCGAYADYYHRRRGQTICRVPDELTDGEVSPVNYALCRVLYRLDQIVSDVFPFADINRAFTVAETGAAIRVSLAMV